MKDDRWPKQQAGRRIVVEVERAKGYGSVPGLEDDELADEAELERMVVLEQWGPILALPCRSHSGIRPVIDELGHRDWGAFGTWDFERLYGGFDKARYKAQKLREELRRCLIMLEMVTQRVPGRAKYLLLKHLAEGVIDFDHIEDEDMRAIAQWYLRAKRIRQQVRELEDYRRRRRSREASSAPSEASSCRQEEVRHVR